MTDDVAGLRSFVRARIADDERVISASTPGIVDAGVPRRAREIRSKGRLLKLAEQAEYHAQGYDVDILTALAEVYSGHPEYDKDWRP